MACCSPTTFPFTNAENSTVEYGPVLQATYGSTPKVFLLYREPDGSYLVAPWFTRIEFSGGEIRVDHGGPQSGLLVVS